MYCPKCQSTKAEQMFTSIWCPVCDAPPGVAPDPYQISCSDGYFSTVEFSRRMCDAGLFCVLFEALTNLRCVAEQGANTGLLRAVADEILIQLKDAPLK